MKKLTTILIGLFLMISTLATATPYGPYLDIGPWKSGSNKWGRTADGHYFDQQGSYANFTLTLPDKNTLNLTISIIETSSAKGNIKRNSFSIENKHEFSGEFKLHILNPGEDPIIQNYKEKSHNTQSFNYGAFDFSSAKNDALLAFELKMNDDEMIYIPLDKETSTWILVAKGYSD